jgi:hypothetical protein
MKEFLTKEAAVGGLNPEKMKLPQNDTTIWGSKLWYYLNHVADETPAWYGKFIAFPDRAGDFNLSQAHHPHVQKRFKEFANNRQAQYYDEKLQKAHHIHIRGDAEHRVLQHHYGNSASINCIVGVPRFIAFGLYCSVCVLCGSTNAEFLQAIYS